MMHEHLVEHMMHEHKIEYPSACTGCEHLAADFVRRAPRWMKATEWDEGYREGKRDAEDRTRQYWDKDWKE